MLIYDLDCVSYLTFCIFRMNGCNPIPYYKATQHGVKICQHETYSKQYITLNDSKSLYRK